MTKKLKKNLKLILIALFFFIVGMAAPLPDIYGKGLLVISFLIVGLPVLKKAGENILRGQVFDENFLMSLATIGAFALQDFAEAAAVMLFYQVGEFFQSYAVNQSRKSIAELMDIRPDYANLLKGEEIVKVSPEQVKVGDLIVIRPGERVPLDGEIVDGFSSLDTAALTGESLPKDVEKGDEVISGCINQTGVLTVKVSKEFANSTVAKILDLVENASSKKANLENFITRFARYYTPTVVIVAVLLALVPPMLMSGESFHEWLYRAITFLVISCPCALVISVPLSFFGGLGAASKAGILIKGSNYLEALAHAEVVVFDKTGTLTKGNFKVMDIHSAHGHPEKVLETAAYAEAFSTHPIALSIKQAYGKKIDDSKVADLQEIHGQGMTLKFKNKPIAVGNAKLMQNLKIKCPKTEALGTVIYVAEEGKYIGHLVIADEIKDDAALALQRLKENGVSRTVMLTGDRKEIAEKIAQELRIDKVYAELLPADKVDQLEKILSDKDRKGQLLYVGDGINDAPVLARSDVGIAMGGIGSDAAIEAADVVIMTDEPSKIAVAMKIATGTVSIARQNVVFAIGVKLIILGLGAFGYASIWAAVFADVGVAVIAILNAMRALFLAPKK